MDKPTRTKRTLYPAAKEVLAVWDGTLPATGGHDDYTSRHRLHAAIAGLRAAIVAENKASGERSRAAKARGLTLEQRAKKAFARSWQSLESVR